jgi:hypothetical protein
LGVSRQKSKIVRRNGFRVEVYRVAGKLSQNLMEPRWMFTVERSNVSTGQADDIDARGIRRGHRPGRAQMTLIRKLDLKVE